MTSRLTNSFGYLLLFLWFTASQTDTFMNASSKAALNFSGSACVWGKHDNRALPPGLQGPGIHPQ